MRQKLLLTLLVLSIGAHFVFAEPARFSRILQSYEGSRSNVYDRQLSLDVQRSQWDTDHSDTTRSFRNTTQAAFHYQTAWRNWTPLRQEDRSFTAGLHLLRNYRGWMLRGEVADAVYGRDSVLFTGGQRVADFDSLLQRVGLSVNLTRQVRWYGTGKHAPFLALGGEAQAFLHSGREESFEPQDYANWNWDKFVRLKHRIAGRVAVQPAVGIGRLVDGSYVYHALALERELRRCGAVKFDLADQTVAALAELMAQRDRTDLRDSDSLKAFKANLDSIVRDDAAVDRDGLRCLSPFAIRRILLREGLAFPTGVRASLYAEPLFGLSERVRSVRYPNWEDESRDTMAWRGDVDLAIESGLRVEGGVAVSRRLHVQWRGEKILYSPELQKRYTAGKAGRWQAYAESRWGAELTWLFGQMFRLSWSLDDLPISLRFVEEGWLPKRVVMGPARSTGVRVDAFIEDYVSFALMLSWHPRRPSDEEPRGAFWTPFVDDRYGTGLFLRATYGF